MADKTGIEWTEATWNPVTGCQKVSQGCKHCYAERGWARLAANPTTVYVGRAFTDVECHPSRLVQPLRWTKPRMFFVNSMSDLFHDDVMDWFLDAVFGVMATESRHVFQVLTKRPRRMHDYLKQDRRRQWADASATHFGARDPDALHDAIHYGPRDLPNVWLGVSVENQAAADERIPLLLQTPAAVRWISAEPLLGPVDLTAAYLPCPNAENVTMDPETGAHECCARCDYTGISDEIGIDWVVVGGESGPNARPMHPQWVRSLRDQCTAAGVPFLFKQHGEWLATAFCDDDMASIQSKRTVYVRSDGSFHDGSSGVDFFGGEEETAWVGKKAAGRLLDGVLHDGYPETQR